MIEGKAPPLAASFALLLAPAFIDDSKDDESDLENTPKLESEESSSDINDEESIFKGFDKDIT